ncbi:GntR family transcriptional regulator, partial [Streptomyces cellulosae]
MTADGPALPAFGGRGPSYRERVADALRAALIAGELRPNEVHSAPALAARFGVSATPVREALLDLAKEGVVVQVLVEDDRGGVTVVRLLAGQHLVEQD